LKIIENDNTQDVITNEELNKENPINRITEDTEELTYVEEAVEITEEELFRDNDAVGDYFEQLMGEAAAMEFEDISSFFCIRRRRCASGKFLRFGQVCVIFPTGVLPCAVSRNCRKHWDRHCIFRVTSVIQMPLCLP